MNSSSVRYNMGAIYLHWIIALLMIYMVFFGEGLIRRQQATFYPSLHVSLGVLILVLSLGRLAWRMMHQPPDLPASMKGWEVSLSHITHWLFYALMILLPLTGMMSFTHQLAKEPLLAGVTVFGMFGAPALPDLFGLGRNSHSIASNVAYFLIILHVLAALKHQFWDKDNILNRMRPH
jgi:cytochrome b561